MFRSSLSRFFQASKSRKTPLGRWSKVNESQQQARVEMNNEDHCGICDELMKKFIEEMRHEEEEQIRSSSGVWSTSKGTEGNKSE